MLHLRIPATTANIGPGYDTFGMALGYYNYLKVYPDEGFSLEIRGEGSQHLSLLSNNLTVRSAKAVFDLAGAGPINCRISMENNIPLSRGLGSSAAAILGGLMSANYALGQPLDQKKLLDMAVEIEGHPDNVTPALLGGFAASCKDDKELVTFRIETPNNLKAIAVVPQLRLSTGKSREVIPKTVSLADAVYNLRHGVLLALSLQSGDLETFGAMLKDRLHQPYRFPLIKGSKLVARKAIEAGAMGCVLSGSGSTMIAFTTLEKHNEDAIGKAMVRAFKKHGIASGYLSLKMDNSGAKLIDN